MKLFQKANILIYYLFFFLTNYTSGFKARRLESVRQRNYSHARHAREFHVISQCLAWATGDSDSTAGTADKDAVEYIYIPDPLTVTLTLTDVDSCVAGLTDHSIQPLDETSGCPDMTNV